jgi:two-component system, LytTR family, response regulator
MLKTILLDDEPYCLELLAHLLKKHCPEVRVEAQFTDSAQALEYLRNNPEPDLLFLDVEMPKINAFDLLSHLYPFRFSVIFTTAYDKYAVRAIKIHAQDYLLKPIDIEELKTAVRKMTQQRPVFQEDTFSTFLAASVKPEEHPSATSRIGISTANGIDFLETATILYCSSDGCYSEIALDNGKKIVLSKPLRDLEDALPKASFFRIHHSYIINLQHIRRYVRGTGGEVVMDNNHSLPVARSKKDAFIRALGSIV